MAQSCVAITAPLRWLHETYFAASGAKSAFNRAPDNKLGGGGAGMGGRGEAWCMAGDPCPRCRSERTVVSDVYMLRQHGRVYAAAAPEGRNKVFGMFCYECGHRARKRGVPGREPSADTHA